MSRPAATRSDHEKFCTIEGWTRVRDARGRTGTHHSTYELSLPDGRVLRTRISHLADRTAYGAALWSHILRDQLDVSENDFWQCVQTGAKPSRGEPEQPRDALPADLTYQLIVKFGVPEQEVATMSKAEAIERLQALWGQEK